jgi:hypothetical protein
MDAIQRMVRFAVPSPVRRGSRIWRLSLAVCVLLVAGAMSGAARADTACSPPTGSATAADAGSITTPQAAAGDSSAGGSSADSTDCSASTGSEAGTAPASPPTAQPPPATPPSSATTTPSATGTAPTGSGPTVSSAGENSGGSCSEPAGSGNGSGTASAVGAPPTCSPPGTDAGTPAVSDGTSPSAPPAAVGAGSDAPPSTAAGGVAAPGPPSSSGPAQQPRGEPAAPPNNSAMVNTAVSDSSPALGSSTDVGPIASSGAEPPPGSQSTISVDGTPRRSTTEPSSTRAGHVPSPASTQQDLARVRRQIVVVEHQLAVEAAQHPRLRRLLGRIASLAASVLSLTAPDGPGAHSTVPFVRDRIVKLDRLLAALGRLSPSAHGRLTPTMVRLHSLLRSLLRQRATTVPSLGAHAGGRGRPALGCWCVPARSAGRPPVMTRSALGPPRSMPSTAPATGGRQVRRPLRQHPHHRGTTPPARRADPPAVRWPPGVRAGLGHS